MDQQDQGPAERLNFTGRKSRNPAAPVGKVEVINVRAIVYGIVLFGALVAIAFFYRLATGESALDKLTEFTFSVKEPVVEDFELSDPVRDILQEAPEKLPDQIDLEERPNIHMTVVPSEVKVAEEVVQTTNVEVEAPKIDMETADIDVDAPEEISETSRARPTSSSTRTPTRVRSPACTCSIARPAPAGPCGRCPRHSATRTRPRWASSGRPT